MLTNKMVLVVAAASLAAAACADPRTDDPVTTNSPRISAVPTAAPESTPPTTRTRPSADDEVRIDVSDGQVTGGPQRIEATVGQTLAVVVYADVADTVHLHGYDIEVPVAPGQPATLTVSVDIPGVFEIELEEAQLKIGELAVRG